MSIYNLGTARVTSGQRLVTGFGTTWQTSGLPGGVLFVGDVSAPIAAIVSDTELTLDIDWPGRTRTSAYAISPITVQTASTVVALERAAQLLSMLRVFSGLGREIAGATSQEDVRRLLGISFGQINIGAAGSFAARAAHDGKPEGFIYLATDQQLLYVRVGQAGWSGGLPFASGRDGRQVEIGASATHIRWRYLGEADSAWREVVPLSSLRGDDGVDGKEIELRRGGDPESVQWRLGDGPWFDLVPIEMLKGDAAESTIAAIEAAERALTEANRAQDLREGIEEFEALSRTHAQNAETARAGAEAAQAETFDARDEAFGARQETFAARDDAAASRDGSQSARAASETARDRSRDWAEKPVDQDVAGAGTRSAMHHAFKAGQSASGASSSAQSAASDRALAQAARQGAEDARTTSTTEANRSKTEADRSKTEADRGLGFANRSEAAATRSEAADVSAITPYLRLPRSAEGAVRLYDFETKRFPSRGTSIARAGGLASRVASDGIYRQAAANEARFDHARVTKAFLGLLVEPESSNLLRNPAALNAASGSPGTLPTYWATFDGMGLTRTVVGSQIVDGLPTVDVRWQGSITSGAASLLPYFDATTQVPGVKDEVFAFSLFLALVAGSWANVGAITLSMAERASDGSSISTGSISGPNILASLGPTFTRYEQIRAMTAANAAFVHPRLTISQITGAVDFTLRFGIPQIEKRSSVTTPIWDATLGVRTRPEDAISVALPNGSYLGDFTLDDGTVVTQALVAANGSVRLPVNLPRPRVRSLVIRAS